MLFLLNTYRALFFRLWLWISGERWTFHVAAEKPENQLKMFQVCKTLLYTLAETKLCTLVTMPIQPSIDHFFPLGKSTPAAFRWEVGRALNKVTSSNKRSHSFTAEVNLESPICISHKCMSLDCLRKSEYLQRNHAAMRQHGPLGGVGGMGGGLLWVDDCATCSKN